MAFSSYADYLTNRRNKSRVILAGAIRGAVTNALGIDNDWQDNGGAAPTTAVSLDKTTAGCAAPTLWSDSGTILLTEIDLLNNALVNPTGLILIDRLGHQGGLSGTTTGPQTTNLPTAALTRYTSGVGVMMAIQIWTAVGSTATTLSCSYTNTSNVGGRTSESVLFGGASNNAFTRNFIPIPLQVGDTGVKSVQSVTIAASTVSAAGNFGVVLYKPLICMRVSRDYWSDSTSGFNNWTWEAVFNGSGHMPQIQQDACLDIIQQQGSVTTSPVGGSLGLARV